MLLNKRGSACSKAILRRTMRACAVCLLERIMVGIADSLARYGFRPISRDAGVVQAGPQSLRRLVKKAPMSKQSGERARPALRRFASDPKNSVELRRTLAETQQQLEHEQEGRERAELRQPLAAALAAIEIQKHNTQPDRQERARRVIEEQVRCIANGSTSV
jgi:hypothetical protein